MTSAESASVAEISLAADFATPGLTDWERKVLEVLSRRRPEGEELNIGQACERLTNHTVDGFTIKPLYTIDDGVKEFGFPGVAPFTRSTTVRVGEIDEDWFSAQLIGEPDPAEARKTVDTDLERGTSTVWVRADLDAVPVDKLAEVLNDILFDLAPTRVSSDTDGLAAAEALAAAFAASDKESIRGSLDIDPIDFATLNGATPDLSVIARAVELVKPSSGACPIVVDASHYDSMGAGDVTQLAYALATDIRYMRALIDLGLNADEAFDSILFRVSANTNQFITISRLRALHTLRNRVGEMLGVNPEKRDTVQHAVTSLRETTRGDVYVSVLRGTISAFTAAVDQAEFITVLPLDTMVSPPDIPTRRIARSTQMVLTKESSIGRVNDPAGGVWSVESIAKQFYEKAWELFGQPDEKGMAAAIADGTMAAQLEEIDETRAKLPATHKLPLTGVPVFPNHLEKAPERAPRPVAPKLGDIPFVRDSQAFEDPRDRSKAAKKTPTVLLACLGTRRDFDGREGFTSNLYHVGGINTVIAEGISPEVFVKTMQKTGTDIAVLCSNAKIYAVHGLIVTETLKETGAQEVRLTGQLEELSGDKAGVNAVIDDNISDGMNAAKLLTSTLDKLEV